MSTLEPIAYRDGETSLSGLIARPAGTPRAAVAVYPTIFNTTRAVEDKARALAEAGYLALVADFYGAMPADMDAARQLAGEIRKDPRVYRQRLHAALEALAGLPEASGLPMLAIGFCMGGGAVLELARDGADLLAVVSYHGLLETSLPAAPGTIKARMLICHGDADVLVPREQVLGFWQEMDAAGGNWHFHSYSGVPHSFTNPYPGATGAIAHDPSADRQSWAATLSLFDEVLGQ